MVELLTVIGIIVILFSILMPAVRVAREVAQRTRCAAQLEQIGAAFLMYTNANQGSLPAWSGWHTWPPGLAGDQEGPAWTVEMIPYLGKPDSPIYHCPSFPTPYDNYFLSAVWASVNGRHAMKLSDVKMNARFVLSGDMTQMSIYPPPYGSGEHPNPDFDLSDEAVACLCFPEQGGFLMHRGGNNVLFDDMHVEAFRAFDRNHLTFDPKQMRSWQEVHDQGPAGP